MFVFKRITCVLAGTRLTLEALLNVVTERSGAKGTVRDLDISCMRPAVMSVESGMVSVKVATLYLMFL